MDNRPVRIRTKNKFECDEENLKVLKSECEHWTKEVKAFEEKFENKAYRARKDSIEMKFLKTLKERNTVK